MSADNWAICPRCVRRARKAYLDQQAEVMAQYGQVTAEKFDELRSALISPEEENFRTFREDYEFWGAEEGVVKYEYSGHCTKCELGLDFDGRRPIPSVEDGS